MGECTIDQAYRQAVDDAEHAYDLAWNRMVEAGETFAETQIAYRIAVQARHKAYEVWDRALASARDMYFS